MVVGVNGVGKTTTRQTRIPIKKAGYKVVLGAGDTFALLQ
jgi:signal recognition particle GTPase